MSRDRQAVLGGRYELRERIGRGGHGDVYAALDHATAQPVAVKLLRDASREVAARFAREARLVSQLTHPNTVRLLDFGQTEGGALFMVLELLRGEPLSACLRRGPLAPELAIHVMRGVLGSLAEAHGRGIVHRDVKPANVFLCDAGPGAVPVIKLLDFGVAKDPQSGAATMELQAVHAAVSGPSAPTAAGGGLTRDDMLIGTPRYMAPEQLVGGAVGPPTDVYAAGLLFAELLSGEPVFGGMGELTLLLTRGSSAMVPLAPLVMRSEFGEAIRRATQVDPALRFANAGEMMASIADTSSAARAAASSSGRRARAARIVAGALAMGFVLGAVVFGVAAQGKATGDTRHDEEADEASEDYENLGNHVVWYRDAPVLDHRDLDKRLGKAGFERIEITENAVQASRGLTTCLVSRWNMPTTRKYCGDLGEAQARAPNGRAWLVVCHGGGAAMIVCVDGTNQDPAGTLRPFVSAYGLDPKVVLDGK